MSDQEAIRRTLAEFCQFLDERKFEDWSRLFTDDGVFGRNSGRTAILASIEEGELAMNPELKRKHTTANSIIDVDGEVAHALSDLVMFDCVADGSWTARVGKYDDQLVRSGDRWLFTHRQLWWV